MILTINRLTNCTTRSMMDVVRLAEELRSEQDCAMAFERDKKLLEAQVSGPCHIVGVASNCVLPIGEGRLKQT